MEQEHSKLFYKVKNYYDSGLWPRQWVWNAIAKGFITEEEFYLICGEDE